MENIVLWFYLGTDEKKVKSKLTKLTDLIELCNYDSVEEDYIFYDKIYKRKSRKYNCDKNRNWLKIEAKNTDLLYSKRFKKYWNRIYNMDDFLIIKSDHKKWENWESINVDSPSYSK